MEIPFNLDRVGLLSGIVAIALATIGAPARAQGPAIGPPDGSSPPCTIRQDPGAPGAPANVDVLLLHGATVSVAVVVNRDGIEIVRNTIDDQTDQVVCSKVQSVTWEEFWSNTETQDIVREAAAAGRVAPPSSAPSGRVLPAALTGDSIYIAAIADSTIGSDRALFVAAAKVGNNPARLNWNLFRIQLIPITGAPFCAPSADAFISDPHVGVSPAGRLFVSFDSSEGSTTTGSILDIDTKSLLRGGPPQMQCFMGTELAGLAPPDVRDDNENAYFVGVRNLAAVKRYKLKVGAHVARDRLIATPDINIPTFAFNPAAVQPNGKHLYAGGFDFARPSIQLGTALWNIHQIGDDGGHAKLRLYKFGVTATDPKMTMTLATLPDQSDDLIAPSLEIDGADAFVSFTRTIAADPVNGEATLMMARGPNGSSAGWTSSVLAASTGQFSKNTLGQPCDTFEFAGCLYGPNSATAFDPINNVVWGFGEIITNGRLGSGKGSEVNWLVKGVAVPR